MLIITFSDGKVFKLKSSVSVGNLIGFLDDKIKKNCVAVKVENSFVFSNFILDKNSSVNLISGKSTIGLESIRYSCLYLLVYTINKLFSGISIVFSFITKDGFYCDIEYDRCLNKEDLKKIEEKMNDLIKKGFILFKKKKFTKLEKTEDNKSIFKKHINLFVHKNYIGIDYNDPHVLDVRFCSNFKLLNISGIYKKDNNNNKISQRIHGTAWFKKKDVYNHFSLLKESKKRDHRKIAKQLSLYYIFKEFPGMIFWDKNGLVLINELKKLIRIKLEYYKYIEVKTPLILDSSIWKKTGHLENYKENIFRIKLENQEFCVKPMNCPGHVQIFKQNIRSYRDLPFRIAEFGVCHRNESSGSLHGLMRSRGFIQDDAHIFCTKKQVFQEVRNCIKMIFDVYKIFGFDKILISLSTRPEKRLGSDEDWNDAEENLLRSLNGMDFDYKIGEGAFYGPKIEFTLCDCLGRFWQCGTIQLDFSLSFRLGAFYIDKKNKKIYPTIIHRAILGSLDRFIGILIEHYSGFFPLWLAPLQVVIINITDLQIDFVNMIEKKMIFLNIRVKKDLRNETVGLKIRDYTLKRVPYIIICGEQEVKLEKISVRNCKGKNLGLFDIDVFIKKIVKEIKYRSIFY